MAVSEQAGTGTSTFNGALNTNTAAGIDLDGTAFTINAAVMTTSDGAVTITTSMSIAVSSGIMLSSLTR